MRFAEALRAARVWAWRTIAILVFDLYDGSGFNLSGHLQSVHRPPAWLSGVMTAPGCSEMCRSRGVHVAARSAGGAGVGPGVAVQALVRARKANRARGKKRCVERGVCDGLWQRGL